MFYLTVQQGWFYEFYKFKFSIILIFLTLKERHFWSVAQQNWFIKILVHLFISDMINFVIFTWKNGVFYKVHRMVDLYHYILICCHLLSYKYHSYFYWHNLEMVTWIIILVYWDVYVHAFDIGLIFVSNI